MILYPEIECADRQQLHELQSKRLAETVKRVYENVPFIGTSLKKRE